jgi:hypothetical protein
MARRKPPQVPDEVLEACIQTETRNLREIAAQNHDFIRENYTSAVDPKTGTVTEESARGCATHLVTQRYKDGWCSVCGGDAVLCAPRHAKNRSCY